MQASSEPISDGKNQSVSVRAQFKTFKTDIGSCSLSVKLQKYIESSGSEKQERRASLSVSGHYCPI